jgi:hypothetical protein
MINQFPRNSKHVSRLPCKDVLIFLEEFDEREFLFGIQTVAYVSNLRRPLHGQRNHLAECVIKLDGRFGGLGLGHDRVGGGGGFAKAYFNSWSSTDASSLATLHITVESPPDVSPHGDGTTRP